MTFKVTISNNNLPILHWWKYIKCTFFNMVKRFLSPYKPQNKIHGRDINGDPIELHHHMPLFCMIQTKLRNLARSSSKYWRVFRDAPRRSVASNHCALRRPKNDVIGYLGVFVGRRTRAGAPGTPVQKPHKSSSIKASILLRIIVEN